MGHAGNWLKIQNIYSNSKEKFVPRPGFEPRTYRPLAWLSSTIDGTGLNLSPESNAMQGVVICDYLSSFDQ